MEFTLNIANICNLKCSYCIFVGRGSGTNITKDFIINLFNLLNYYLLKGEKVSLTFSGGGEPLLFFNDIKNIINGLKNIKNKNLDIYLISNGTIYDYKISKFIKNNNIILILSLDGNDTNHNINRVLESNGIGTFELIKSNKNLLYNDVLEVNYTIYFNNFNNLIESIKYIEKNFNKLKRINFNFVFNTNVWENNLLIKLKKEFFEFLDFFLKNKFFLKFETNLRNFSYYGTLESEEGCLSHLYINRDGLIYKCGAYEFNFDGKPFGNISNINFEDLEKMRLSVKKCGLKCKQSEFASYNKKLEHILLLVGKKYLKIDKLVLNKIRKGIY